MNLQSIAYRTTSPRGPRAHLSVTYFQFHSTTFYLVFVLYVSLHQKICNSLLRYIQQSQTLSSFRRHLKPHYILSVSLPCPLATIPNAPWFSSEILALYKSLTTYLLTYLLTYLQVKVTQQFHQPERRSVLVVWSLEQSTPGRENLGFWRKFLGF